jgi:carbonic anhydrase
MMKTKSPQRIWGGPLGICCANSRVSPEFIFDQPIRSILEILNAGNVMDDDAIASIEYWVEHLHFRFLCVLGHKGCGAIETVHDAGDRPLHDHSRALQDRVPAIKPRILAFRNEHSLDILAQLTALNAH